MTFKHAKFEDSVIMRSLERVAKEKGLIKDEPIQKTASAQVDLKPSESFMQNILTLCAGLRAQGFDKHANELEVNFLAYKQAANVLYETDPKAGEKQIRDAHPKGSPKLEGVESGDLAVIETVIDEHLKLLDIVNKKPTGKLASSADVLKAVKNVLGEQTVPPQEQELIDKINNALRTAYMKWNYIEKVIVEEGKLSLFGRAPEFSQATVKIKQLLKENPKTDDLRRVVAIMGKIKGLIKPGITGGVSSQAWTTLGEGDLITDLMQFISSIANDKSDLNRMRGLRQMSNAINPISAPVPVNETVIKINNALSQFKDLETLINVDNDPANADDKAKALAWVRSRVNQLITLKAAFDKKSPAEQNQSAADFTAAVNKITANYNAVRQQWV